MADNLVKSLVFLRGSTMEVDILLLADYASVSENKKLNVMGVFNRIFAKGFPVRHREMFVVSKCSASIAEANSTKKFVVKLLDEDAGVELLNFARNIVVGEPQAGKRYELNGILKVADVIFPKAGTYQVSVLIDGDEKASMPLYVEQVDASDNEQEG